MGGLLLLRVAEGRRITLGGLVVPRLGLAAPVAIYAVAIWRWRRRGAARRAECEVGRVWPVREL
eukprot:5121940-Prymnesium_polylepis.1